MRNAMRYVIYKVGLRRNYLHKYVTLNRNFCFALTFHAYFLGKEQPVLGNLTMSY